MVALGINNPEDGEGYILASRNIDEDDDIVEFCVRIVNNGYCGKFHVWKVLDSSFGYVASTMSLHMRPVISISQSVLANYLD